MKIDRLKAFTHLAAAAPLAWLIRDYLYQQLTFNPIREIQLRTGKDALVLLILALSCAPIKARLNLPQVMRVRRSLGLWAFAYACLHFLTFIGLDYRFDPDLIAEGILKKPFALAGLAAFLILIPLAATSTNGWARRLGKNWRRLHRLVYVAAALAAVHFFWIRSSKLDIGEPLTYGSIIAVLLIARLPGVKRAMTPAGAATDR